MIDPADIWTIVIWWMLAPFVVLVFVVTLVEALLDIFRRPPRKGHHHESKHQGKYHRR
jgi:hypothetical protein